MGKFFDEDHFLETRKEQKQAQKLAIKKDRSKYKKTDTKQRERLKKLATKNKLAKSEVANRGRVLAITPEGISVQHKNHVYLCTLRGALKKEITRAKNLITVGDFVQFKETSITHIEKRRSVLSRQEHLRRRKIQLIAANIDQVLITVSVLDPTLKPHLIDRYLIATYKGNMQPAIIINKIDLVDKQSEKVVKQVYSTYSSLGIPVICLSAQTGEGIERLKKQMKGQASVFSGQSGVGKSSLINAMTGLSIPVADIVKKTRKGAHTTTTTHLIPLSFGGWCIDTPGIRSFGVWDLQKEDLHRYFPEIKAASQHCKYPNCTHVHEPDCAIEKAIEEGKISPLRFQSYLKFQKE